MRNGLLNSITGETTLNVKLVELVLARLGFVSRPEPTLENLRALYAAWCQRVPFDNVRKLIHVRSGESGDLPGRRPADFFAGWLQHGTGGTCWAGAGALHGLLTALGFEAARGFATMLVRPDLRPNHGTVQVSFGDEDFLVDSSMLHREPLRLAEFGETQVLHPAWGVRCYWRDERPHIWWRPLNRLDGFECRLDRFGATLAEYQEFHDQTRGWSPFNFELSARLNRGQDVVGVAGGYRVCLHHNGSVSRTPLSC